MYIKVYLSESEKKVLEELARHRKISVSKLCYEQLSPLLSQGLEELLANNPNLQDVSQPYKHCARIYLSENEYTSLIKGANGMPLSRYLRKILMNRRQPIIITVYTEDISALSIKVSSYIEQLHNFIAALAIRRQLYEADYKRLIQIASDTQTALRDVAKHTKANRSSIRTSGVRILRKEIQKAITDLGQSSPTST